MCRHRTSVIVQALRRRGGPGLQHVEVAAEEEAQMKTLAILLCLALGGCEALGSLAVFFHYVECGDEPCHPQE